MERYDTLGALVSKCGSERIAQEALSESASQYPVRHDMLTEQKLSVRKGISNASDKAVVYSEFANLHERF